MRPLSPQCSPFIIDDLIHSCAFSIYGLEKGLSKQPDPPTEDSEASPLLDASTEDPDKVFTRYLDAELEKITSFYQLKELEILGELDAFFSDKEAYDADEEDLEDEHPLGRPGSRSNRDSRGRSGSIFGAFLGSRAGRRRTSTFSQSERRINEDGDSDEDFDENTALNKTNSRDGNSTWDRDTDLQHSTGDVRSNRRRASVYEDDYDLAFSALYDSAITLKKRAIGLYVNVSELRSFIQLNRTGFSKVLKKYDKIIDRRLKNGYITANIEPAHAFQKSTMAHLQECLERLEVAFADLVSNGDVAEAKRQLRLHLREHVVWERNTVWREMIGIERKSQAANIGIRQTLLGVDTDPSRARLQGDEPEVPTKEFSTPVGRVHCPKFLLSSSFYILVGIIAVFCVLLAVPILEKREQQNCLAMVIFVSLLWATEVRVPLVILELLLTRTGYTIIRHLNTRTLLSCAPWCHT